MSKKVGRASGRGGHVENVRLEAAGGGRHVDIFENLKKKPTPPPHILNDTSLMRLKITLCRAKICIYMVILQLKNTPYTTNMHI